MNTPSRARLDELLAAEATQPLSPAEEVELDGLLSAFPDQDPDAYELAAAAVHLALATPEPLPGAVAEKLHLAAVAMVPGRGASPARAHEKPARSAVAAWAGWAVAAGLAGLLVYAAWPRPEPTRLPVVVEKTLEQKRDELLKDAPARPARFAVNKDNAAASVVWSDVKQEGYLEVRGLPPNDPKKEKYQLWVVDTKRGKDFPPISAGLFDVKPGTNMVPVSAALPVGDAAMFVISKEGPNGVWVTTPDRFVLVLPAKAG